MVLWRNYRAVQEQNSLPVPYPLEADLKALTSRINVRSMPMASPCRAANTVKT